MRNKHYLNWCLASVVSDHEVHSDIFAIHVFINPVPDVGRHHVCEQVTKILRERYFVKYSTAIERF